MASAGVLKFQAPRSQSRSRPKAIQRRRRTLNCIQCRSLKVSCDRKLPCGRCEWRGKSHVCFYVEFPNQASQRDGESTTGCGRCDTQVICFVDVTCPITSVFDHDNSGHVDLVNSHSLLPQLTLDWRLAKTLTGLYKQLSSVLEFLNNPLEPPILVQRGQTHWQAVLDQCATSIPTLLDDLTTSYSKPSGSCPSTFSPMRFPSFPFEIDLDGRPATKSQIIARYLPSKEITKMLVRAYLDTIEGVNRLFHVPTFELELECYWLNPSSASYDWLAQLLTILALGTRITQERMGHELAALHLPCSIERYLRGASSCLAQLSYPFHASLETVRTLCLMATAKKASLFSCHERDACGPLLDTALHMCLTLGLDQRMRDGNLTRQDWLRTVKENRVWTTVRYMYLHHSMHAGTSVLLSPSIMQPGIPINANDVEIDSTWTANDSIHDVGEWTGSSAELLISRSLPLVSAIISLANPPPATEPQRVDLIVGDALIRDLLREIEMVFAEPGSTWKCLQRCMLIVYFRRVLLTIYHLGSRCNTPKSVVDTTRVAAFSPLAETECAISILVQQRCMLEDAGFSRDAGRVVAELYKEDFLIAALVIGGQWMRTTCFLSSLSVANHSSDNLSSPKCCPSGEASTVLEGLHWCRELWARDVEHSICNFAAHSILGRLLDVLGDSKVYLIGG